MCYAACQILCNSDGSQEKKKEKKHFLLYACVPVSVCIVRLSLKKKRPCEQSPPYFLILFLLVFFCFFFYITKPDKAASNNRKCDFPFHNSRVLCLDFKKSLVSLKKRKKVFKNTQNLLFSSLQHYFHFGWYFIL